MALQETMSPGFHESPKEELVDHLQNEIESLRNKLSCILEFAEKTFEEYAVKVNDELDLVTQQFNSSQNEVESLKEELKRVNLELLQFKGYKPLHNSSSPHATPNSQRKINNGLFVRSSTATGSKSASKSNHQGTPTKDITPTKPLFIATSRPQPFFRIEVN